MNHHYLLIITLCSAISVKRPATKPTNHRERTYQGLHRRTSAPHTLRKATPCLYHTQTHGRRMIGSPVQPSPAGGVRGQGGGARDRHTRERISHPIRTVQSGTWRRTTYEYHSNNRYTLAASVVAATTLLIDHQKLHRKHTGVLLNPMSLRNYNDVIA